MNLSNWNYLIYNDFSKIVKEIADLIGFDAVISLLKIFPLEGLYIPKNFDLAKKTLLRELRDSEIQEIVNAYGSTKLYLPKDRALTRARNRRIKAEAKSGLKTASSYSKYYAEVAQTEGICIATVKRIIKGRD